MLSMCPTVASYAFELGVTPNGTIGTGYSGVADLVLSSPGVITAGLWYKVTMTFSSGVHSLYVNGASVGASAPSIGNNPLNHLFLGGGHQGALNYKGYVDDVCIYNRALTATEVQTYDTPIYSNSTWYNVLSLNNYNSNYTPVKSGVDSDTEYQLCSQSNIPSGATFYSVGKIQQYSSFSLTFEFKVTVNGGGVPNDNRYGNNVYFYCGMTEAKPFSQCSQWHWDTSPGMYANFQVYNAQYNLSAPGTYLELSNPSSPGWIYNPGGDTSEQTGYNTATNKTAAGTSFLNNINWNTVKIDYVKGTTNTWTITLNGVQVIQQSDPNNAAWLSSSGTFWGIGSNTAVSGRYMNSYLRKFALTYTN